MDHIPAVLERVRPEYLQRTYQVSGWNNSTEFLEKVATKAGRLLKVTHVYGFCEKLARTYSVTCITNFLGEIKP